MSKVDELLEFIETTKTPDEIIMAIFAEFDTQNIPKDPKIIHEAVYKFKGKEEYSDLLDQFVFDVSGLYPFSDLLDQIIFRLESSCILSTLNPRYEQYELPKNLLRKVFDDFSDEEKQKISDLAKQIQATIT